MSTVITLASDDEARLRVFIRKRIERLVRTNNVERLRQHVAKNKQAVWDAVFDEERQRFDIIDDGYMAAVRTVFESEWDSADSWSPLAE
jgi:hypothetical protein